MAYVVAKKKVQVTQVNFYKEHNFLMRLPEHFITYQIVCLWSTPTMMLWHTQLWFSLHYFHSITSKLLPSWVCTNRVSMFVPTERTRRSPRWQWESSVRTKSPRRYSPLRTGVELCLWISCNFSCCCSRTHRSSASPSSDTSTTSAACCPAPSKWTAAPCSSTRSSFHHCQTSKQEAVSFSRRLALHVALVFSNCWQSYVSISAGFFPFLKIYQSLQLVYTSGV